MLERVPLDDQRLDDHRDVVGAEFVERVRRAAEPLQGARVLHVNATAHGGGVAELLRTQVPLLRDLGIDAEWQVLPGDDDFFAATKSLHNALQGMSDAWDATRASTVVDHVRATAADLEGEWDVVVVHDPQPLALAACASSGATDARVDRWVWRCHLDLTEADADASAFVQSFTDPYDALVFSLDEFVPPGLATAKVQVFPPSIDPLAPKNADLSQSRTERLLRHLGADPDRPLVCQISRFDPWKDPVGVIEAFRAVQREIPDAQLVLAGSMADDDPEGEACFREVREAARGLDDVHLVTELDDEQVNALQRGADVVVQKSLREGYGLTVSEALWKATPVVAGRVGGIVLQVRDGENGFLVDSVDDCAARVVELLRDPARAATMGEQGREDVRARGLATTELLAFVELLADLTQQAGERR